MFSRGYPIARNLTGSLPARSSIPLRSDLGGLVRGEPCAEFRGDVGVEDGVVAFVADVEHMAGAVDFREESGFVCWDAELSAQPPGGEADFQLLDQ